MTELEGTPVEAPVEASPEASEATETTEQGQASQESEGSEKASQEPELPEWAKPGFKHKIKADGQELELEYDDLVRMASKASAADNRMREATTTKKEAKSILDGLRSNPVEALKQLESNTYFQENPNAIVELLGKEGARKFAESLLWEEIQREKMSPERQELEDLRKFKQQQEELAKEREEAEKHQRYEAERARYRDQYTKQFTEALETGGLPKTPETIETMAQLYMSALENDYEPDMKELVDATRDQLQNRTRSLLGGLPEETLVELLGDDIAGKIRKHDLSRLRSPTKAGQIITQDEREESPHEKNLSIDEARKLWRQRAGL